MSCRQRFGCPGRAHPRGCGEHAASRRAASLTGGSSPRVRGTSFVPKFNPGAGGLIPAGAGNILTIQLIPSKWRAHPRGCGEHAPATDSEAAGEGSSPRVRGTFRGFSFLCHGNGLIPAGAGNIQRSYQGGSQNRAHPRGCGEHLIYLMYI